MKPDIPERQIRANFDGDSVVVYQAYSPRIAIPALAAQRLVPPFSLTRMTWVKPSFLWMMERSGWAQKENQERVLSIRLGRENWENLLGQSALSAPRLGQDKTSWQREMRASPVRVQWDPERSLLGEKLPYRSIQVGIGSELAQSYALDWILGISDVTPLVYRMAELLAQERLEEAERLLPPERIYPVPEDLQAKLNMR